MRHPGTGKESDYVTPAEAAADPSGLARQRLVDGAAAEQRARAIATLSVEGGCAVPGVDRQLLWPEKREKPIFANENGPGVAS